MHPIIYDFAVSIDGYISGPDGDISQFAHEGKVGEDCTARLETYATAIMAGPPMNPGIGSESNWAQPLTPRPGQSWTRIVLPLDPHAEVAIQPPLDSALFDTLRANVDAPIYLSGGGNLAAAVIEMGHLTFCD